MDSPAYVAGLAGNASGAEDAESAIAKVARLARRAGPTRARRIADAARRVGSVALVTVGERRPRAVSIVLSCLTDAARFELSVGAKCHPLFKCIGAFSRVTTEHNDAREGAMPSNTLAAFAAGLFVATLVLTHDASAGDELLVARGLLLPSPSPAFEIHASRNASLPDPNVVEGRAGRDAPEGTKATDHPDGEAIDATRVSDASDATDDLSLGVRETRAPREVHEVGARALELDASPMTTREAFAAAMATTRLALRLWAHAGRPATDALEWYTRAGSREFLATLWRVVQIVSNAPARVKALVVAGFAALVAARAAALALTRHLRRARYRARRRWRVSASAAARAATSAAKPATTSALTRAGAFETICTTRQRVARNSLDPARVYHSSASVAGRPACAHRRSARRVVAIAAANASRVVMGDASSSSARAPTSWTSRGARVSRTPRLRSSVASDASETRVASIASPSG